MTTIVSLHQKGETWIGADTQATLGNQRFPGTCPKWVIKNNMAVGCSGNYRIYDLLNQAQWPLLPQEIPELIKQVMKHDGYQSDAGVGPLSFRQSFILATPKQVFSLDSCLTMTPIPKNVMWADGSGSSYALGCSTMTTKLSPKDRILHALQAGVQYDIYSSPPFFLERIAK